LIHDAKTGAVKYLNGGGRAAAGGTLEAMADRGLTDIPFRGVVPATLTVPGALASWDEAHKAYGRLPLVRILESAIGYARDGFPVTERLAGHIVERHDDLVDHEHSARIFLPDGTPPAAGTKLVNPDLARSLERFAADGWAGFYEGETATEMARFAAERGGVFTAEDFANQKARWGEPLVGEYRGVTVYNTPPPTQGFTVLEMLNLIEPFDLHKMEFLSADHIHLLVQAKQIAFHDRDLLLADPDFVDVPIDQLISKAYADERRALIDMQKALPWNKVPSHGSLAGDTVYMAAIDSEGNAVSLIQSLFAAFGSGVVAGNTGVMLQNRASYFSLDPAHPNRLEPGKIPLHTLMASMSKRGGDLWSVLGTQGADGQPQIQLQLLTDMIDFGLNIQEALELPRFLSGRISLGEARDMLHLEGRMPEATFDGLAARGHKMNRWADWNNRAGHAHGIVIEPGSGLYTGGSDPRSDGAAVGY
ncbi:MAG: gamma-glutamyltransferase family protein, partial [Rhodospirillaceae bacterium]|nr:gamma-glutamyltransferase family protein [Rhodospirillaceae bacterium]